MELGGRLIAQEFLFYMTPEIAVEIFRHTLLEVFWLAIPILAIGFTVGIAMSLLQVLTSIQDSAFSAVPRLVAFLGGFALALPWMLQKMTMYTVSLLGDLGRYGR